MMKAKKMRVFINTENTILGKALDRSKCFRGTTFDHKKREIVYDEKYAHRRGGIAWRKEYCGNAVHGYGRMTTKLGKMRENRAKLIVMNTAQNSKPICSKYHKGSRVPMRSVCSVVDFADSSRFGALNAVGDDCRSLCISGENQLGSAISAIGYADTS